MMRWLNFRTILIVGSILLVLATVVAVRETERFRHTEYSQFIDQSGQLASLFARSASIWLDRGNEESLKFAVDLLMAGSGQYVRVVIGHETVLDERLANSDIEAMDLSYDSQAFDDSRLNATLRKGGVDILVPITSSDGRTEATGVVQIGFADTQATARVRGHRALIFGTVAGAWFTLMLAGGFVVRILDMRSRLQSIQPKEARTDGMIHCGALTIDTETCAVQLDEQSVVLTPKTFELLVLLARNEGKTFTDADLLAKLWSDSPYSASGDVRQCIYLLRRRLGIACSDPKEIIANVKGFGYKLEAPIRKEPNPD
jgi:DNA-binding winged helix-turn-helix (wHTH) protein